MTSAKKLFVTGIDTGIGKTFVSSLLLAAAHQAFPTEKLAYLKPVQTGVTMDSGEMDADAVRATLVQAGVTMAQVELETTYCFEIPAAPTVADVDGEIELTHLAKRIAALSETTDFLLVEGAGGLMVPMTNERLLIDCLAEWQIPTVLVTSPRLGAINQTLLSVEALERRGIEIYAIVVNWASMTPTENTAEETFLQQLSQWVSSLIPIVPCYSQSPMQALDLPTLFPESLKLLQNC